MRHPVRADGARFRGCRIAASTVATALRRGGLPADAAPHGCAAASLATCSARATWTRACHIRRPYPMPRQRNLPRTAPPAPSRRSPAARAMVAGRVGGFDPGSRAPSGRRHPVVARRRGSVGSACTRSCGCGTVTAFERPLARASSRRGNRDRSPHAPAHGKTPCHTHVTRVNA
jgi:hypothetical protein